MKPSLEYINEPSVLFGHNQTTDDCRDGLTLFGPYETAVGAVRAGVIGLPSGIRAYRSFVSDVNKPVFTESAGRPFFPGFQTVFGLRWESTPQAIIELPEAEVSALLAEKNLHERTYKLVTLYLDEIKKYLENEERQVDLWYIIIPHDIWLLCRPESASRKASIPATRMQTFLSGQVSLFPEEDAEVEEYARMYESDPDFHDQMKARILAARIQTPVQIMLEETLYYQGKDKKPYDDDMKAHILWTQCTSTYYKLGYLPWKLSGVRDGVCYIGLVFKALQDYQRHRGYACCAAQMFLDSGDGMVFRGNLGPWLSKNEKTFHLDKDSAFELIERAVSAYRDNTGRYPKELFIHGRTKFTDEEWQGFSQAVSASPNTNLVGVTINEFDGFRIMKDNYGGLSKYGVLRGLFLPVDSTSGYLWTKGFIPRTQTANHMEVARPLKVAVSRGHCDLETVMTDILCLTKLNYNACIYGDGLPVTLRFSDRIGGILTALKEVNWAARQFKYYI